METSSSSPTHLPDISHISRISEGEKYKICGRYTRDWNEVICTNKLKDKPSMGEIIQRRVNHMQTVSIHLECWNRHHEYGIQLLGIGDLIFKRKEAHQEIYNLFSVF